MKNTLISLVYFCIAGAFMATMDSEYAIILKGLLLPLLALYFLVNSRLSGWMNRMFFMALLFSWGGDVLLEIPDTKIDLFLPGLFSFLVAQVLYFNVFAFTPGKNTIMRSRPWVLIPVVMYAAGLIYILYDSLGNMKIPVFIYTAVILSMVCSAITRFGKVSRKSWIIVLAGAILFLLSDSGIAINRFYRPFPGAEIWIMSTYVMAQFLIVNGYLEGRASS